MWGKIKIFRELSKKSYALKERVRYFDGNFLDLEVGHGLQIK